MEGEGRGAEAQGGGVRGAERGRRQRRLHDAESRSTEALPPAGTGHHRGTGEEGAGDRSEP